MTKDEQQSMAMATFGAFWAFGEEQYKRQKVYGVEYVELLGAGLFCPKENADKLLEALRVIHPA